MKGVYAVEVMGLGDKPLAGVANIGTRPTVAGNASSWKCIYWTL
ncbi:riboflavin kinase [Shigella flexneri]